MIFVFSAYVAAPTLASQTNATLTLNLPPLITTIDLVERLEIWVTVSETNDSFTPMDINPLQLQISSWDAIVK